MVTAVLKMPIPYTPGGPHEEHTDQNRKRTSRAGACKLGFGDGSMPLLFSFHVPPGYNHASELEPLAGQNAKSLPAGGGLSLTSPCASGAAQPMVKAPALIAIRPVFPTNLLFAERLNSPNWITSWEGYSFLKSTRGSRSRIKLGFPLAAEASLSVRHRPHSPPLTPRKRSLPITLPGTAPLQNPERGLCCLNHPQREQSIHTCGQRLEADMAQYTKTHPHAPFLTRNTESVLRHGQNLGHHDPPV